MNLKDNHLIVSSAPHIVNPVDTSNIMKNVVIALMPALAVAIYVFGMQALLLTVTCVASCVIFEGLSRKILNRPQTIGDFSAVVTGVILSYNLPAGLPLWMAVIGSFVAIVVVKQLFGGLGQNFVNPAIVGRIVLFTSFATPMTTWPLTERMSSVLQNTGVVNTGVDAITGATPLALFSNAKDVPSNMEMFLGTINGSMGEISAAALLLGGLYLVFKKIIEPTIPAAFIGTVAVMALMMGFDPIFHICAGGVMLGAIFMATDYVTSPLTTKGKIIFGIGCGFLTMIIRIFASYPEGVSFALLLMNILVPHIDKWTKVKLNGVPKGGDKS
ncbi:MAG: RnfABCDGE type electron transport complex subunit D [Bacillota bacterium]|jgi:electron transport complex protein RnfD|nr:RnfABCDGE type electron transport complex subunit D [Eubacteriales bacterium]MDI9492180.1 RnfABCDGE type electron transport complex subunit D [Bacillota bacterium]NLV70661.1 RnfABCDGE type electron transport complex subunit D [Clostridiales bacterium]MDD3536739.1 RnfABCDGE type electron transport complex subunit D [Eubacteriales bacterium]MDD4285736.1 RnfABCDGE type electron transport complex subunit D [Eubacteriales bacterium]